MNARKHIVEPTPGNVVLPSRTDPKAKANAVAVLADAFDANFFKAIGEPVRQQILMILLLDGPSNIQSVAQHLAQDRSVVSRHLAVLKQAGILRSQRIQRFTQYEIDGPAIISKLERLLQNLRSAAQLCCPPAVDSRP